MALSNDPKYQNLQEWYQANAGSLNMREMFASDPDRFSRFRWEETLLHPCDSGHEGGGVVVGGGGMLPEPRLVCLDIKYRPRINFIRVSLRHQRSGPLRFQGHGFRTRLLPLRFLLGHLLVGAHACTCRTNSRTLLNQSVGHERQLTRAGVLTPRPPLSDRVCC